MGDSVKIEAEPGEIVLAIGLFVGDATTCHGFGAGYSPYLRTREAIGVMGKTGKMEWADLTESLNWRDTFRDDRAKMSWPDRLLQKVGVSSTSRVDIIDLDNTKEKLNLAIWKKEAEFKNWAMHGQGGYRNYVPDNIFLSMAENTHVVIFRGEDKIREYLTDTVETKKLIGAYNELGVAVPEKLSDKEVREAKEEVRQVYASYLTLAAEEGSFQKRQNALVAATRGSGAVMEGGALVPVETEEDVMIVTMGQRSELARKYSEIASKVKELKEKGVPKLVKQLEVQPGITVDVPKFFDTLEKTFGEKDVPKTSRVRQ